MTTLANELAGLIGALHHNLSKAGDQKQGLRRAKTHSKPRSQIQAVIKGNGIEMSIKKTVVSGFCRNTDASAPPQTDLFVWDEVLK
jgi:hypothetical protein